MRDRSPAGLTRLRRTFAASAVLFAVVFVFLAGQMWLGRDPALGDGSARRGQEARPEQHASVLDTVLGVAAAVIQDDDEHEGGAPAVRTQTS